MFDFVEAPSLTLTESVVVPLVNSQASTVVVTTSVTVSVWVVSSVFFVSVVSDEEEDEDSVFISPSTSVTRSALI